MCVFVCLFMLGKFEIWILRIRLRNKYSLRIWLLRMNTDWIGIDWIRITERIQMAHIECVVGHFPWLILIGNEPNMMEIGLYSPVFAQAPWKFLLDLPNNDATESNSHCIKFISRKKESIKCPTAKRTPGNPCKAEHYSPLTQRSCRIRINPNLAAD